MKRSALVATIIINPRIPTAHQVPAGYQLMFKGRKAIARPRLYPGYSGFSAKLRLVK